MKSTIKKIVDLAMMVIIVILMAYFITGREFSRIYWHGDACTFY